MDTRPLPTALPCYTPPACQHAVVAAGLAPIGVLLAFVGVVTRLVAVDTGLAGLAACTLWLMTEMHLHQRRLDAYNATFVQRHLAWRSNAHLAALCQDPRHDSSTRDFVQRHLDDGRQLRPDRPTLG